MPRDRRTPILLIIFVVLLSLLGPLAARFEPESKRISSDRLVPVPESSNAHLDSTQRDSTQNAPDEMADSSHPLDPLLQVARDLQAHMEADIQDYTAILVKRERVQGRLGPETRMFLKVRNPQQVGEQELPLAAYLRFIEPKSTRGREVIWVEGQNENRLISHESGFLNIKRFELAPDSMLAMMGNKYPITEIGLLRLVEKLVEKGERDRLVGSCEVVTLDGQMVGDRECRMYQIKHPEKSEEFDFHIAQIFVDTDRNIPLRYAAFMWPEPGQDPPLEEEYTYLDVRLNAGLSAADFDPENPDYNFP